MDSDLHRRHNYQHQQQIMINSGIYGAEDVTPLFISSDSGGDNLSYHQNLGRIRGDESQFMNSKNQEQRQMMYQNLVQSHEIVNDNNLIVSSSSSAMADRLMAMDHAPNLLRQSSSPAGFFEHIHMDNGYSMMRYKDKFQHANGSVQDSSNRMKSPMAFPSRSHSSSRQVSHIHENTHQTMGHNNGEFGESHSKSSSYIASFPIGSWGESSIGFIKELSETDQISSCENQNEVEIHAPTGLTHQLSLPTSSTELSLRSRAKRGCATHPRSIAERVRRTRISERMRKLQDLVPNMDHQTSIADMLGLAVDYIKDLQKQVETLSDHAKCTCPNKQKL